MTIAEVGRKYGMTPDTLRYYERMGLIPPVHRTQSGLRDFTEGDMRWVEFVRCMRAAGVTIETLAEYVALFRGGAATVQARKKLLEDQREQIAQRIAEQQAALERLDYKLDGYEERMVAQCESRLKITPD
ncbi:MAG: MerR family transcriptional regulator [Clostridia bacterium]